MAKVPGELRTGDTQEPCRLSLILSRVPVDKADVPLDRFREREIG